MYVVGRGLVGKTQDGAPLPWEAAGRLLPLPLLLLGRAKGLAEEARKTRSLMT